MKVFTGKELFDSFTAIDRSVGRMQSVINAGAWIERFEKEPKLREAFDELRKAGVTPEIYAGLNDLLARYSE